MYIGKPKLVKKRTSVSSKRSSKPRKLDAAALKISDIFKIRQIKRHQKFRLTQQRSRTPVEPTIPRPQVSVVNHESGTISINLDRGPFRKKGEGFDLSVTNICYR